MNKRRITSHEVTQVLHGFDGEITVTMDRTIERCGMSISNSYGKIVLTPGDLALIMETVEAFSCAEAALVAGAYDPMADLAKCKGAQRPFPFLVTPGGKDDGSAA
ncbi:MAG: hypothetical protein A2516_10040 [Alphaproteobacteria bacterium RIFOXYD12_FULL_60_8]|nr:MAG: hypothetical protein A2516_10040 [Alphaproteobacteria bacterium RIFOXYD12_FULL_60_8]